MRVQLAINTGFAVNRYVLPEQWVPFVAEVLGIRWVQFTADMLMPYLAEPLGRSMADRTRACADRYGVRIGSTFTGAFTRLNHFSHPDPSVRDYWMNWFRTFVDITAVLGADSLGSHFGIQTLPDSSDARRREDLFRTTVDAWRRLAEYGSKRGLRFLTWEPMSISREYGETIEKAAQIQAAVSDFAIPMRMCLDVDHGDTASPCPSDVDPYAWLERFAPVAPLIHVKQSLRDKSGHWAFTPRNNALGTIEPTRVLAALERGGAGECCLILELSFRERAAVEARMTEELRQSVAFWRPHCQE